MASSSNPASALLAPSRPTTATTASPPPSSFLIDYTSPFVSPRPSPTPFAILPLFTKYAKPIRGTVRIRVEDEVFYCHREVLMLSSPFFESVLTGGWRETEPRVRKKDAEVVREPAVEEEEEAVSPGLEVEGARSKRESYSTTRTTASASTETSVDEDTPATTDRTPLLVFPPSSSPPLSPSLPSPTLSELDDLAPSMTASYVSSVMSPEDSDDDSDDDEEIVCRLRLREEKAASFQDLLCFVYPRLDFLVSWANAAELIRMASKFDMPALRTACVAFLLPSAAGNPLQGMKIAEDNNIPELYKEASRYTLDNYHQWPASELAQLSQSTLLKLERRRSWFLERLLKLGLVQTSRDYVCQPTCPDQSLCARLVDEKWRSAWSSAFRFGTPQPSIIYRSLRSLEPSLSSPALHLPHTACQSHARLYVAEMFGLGIVPARSWGSLAARSAGNAGDGIGKNSSSARYFLSVEMGEPGVGKKL